MGLLPPRHRPRSVTAAAIGLALTFGLVGCRPAVVQADGASKRAIERVMARYLEAYRGNDPDAISRLYDPDAVLLPPGSELIRGRESIREFWARGMEAGFDLETVQLEVAGGTGYVVGRYYLPADGEDDAETGKCVVTLRRGIDGVWRITADIWNADEEEPGFDNPEPRSTAS